MGACIHVYEWNEGVGERERGRMRPLEHDITQAHHIAETMTAQLDITEGVECHLLSTERCSLWT